MYRLTNHGLVVRLSDGAFIPPDPANSDWTGYLDWVSGGGVADAPPPATFPQRVAALLSRVDALLSEAARQKGYDDIRSAALRAGYPGPFHDEGVVFAQWMDATYAACYQLLAQVQAGEIPEPTELELLAMLPALDLP